MHHIGDSFNRSGSQINPFEGICVNLANQGVVVGIFWIVIDEIRRPSGTNIALSRFLPKAICSI